MGDGAMGDGSHGRRRHPRRRHGDGAMGDGASVAGPQGQQAFGGLLGGRLLNLDVGVAFIAVHEIGGDHEGEHDAAQHDREKCPAALIIVCHSLLPLEEVI